jgi:hypothetical protein
MSGNHSAGSGGGSRGRPPAMPPVRTGCGGGSGGSGGHGGGGGGTLQQQRGGGNSPGAVSSMPPPAAAAPQSLMQSGESGGMANQALHKLRQHAGEADWEGEGKNDRNRFRPPLVLVGCLSCSRSPPQQQKKPKTHHPKQTPCAWRRTPSTRRSRGW